MVDWGSFACGAGVTIAAQILLAAGVWLWLNRKKEKPDSMKKVDDLVEEYTSQRE